MPKQYIPLTKEERELARKTDIAELLRSQGEELKRSGSEWMWMDNDQIVTIRGNLWFHQYEQVGGDAVDFICRYYDKSYPEAVEYLLYNRTGTPVMSPPVIKKRKPFALPEPNNNMRRIYAYLLKQRGLDSKVLNAFVARKMIYESADYHNAVFVGFNPKGAAVHAHKRSTGSESRFKGNADSSNPSYSFHWQGKDKFLFIFEAPIDMLSFISMHQGDWQEHSYAASCGTSDKVIWQMMNDNPNISFIYLCRDNDDAGKMANERTAKILSEKGIPYKILIPEHKDWNEDLLHLHEVKEEEECIIQQQC